MMYSYCGNIDFHEIAGDYDAKFYHSYGSGENELYSPYGYRGNNVNHRTIFEEYTGKITINNDGGVYGYLDLQKNNSTKCNYYPKLLIESQIIDNEDQGYKRYALTIRGNSLDLIKAGSSDEIFHDKSNDYKLFFTKNITSSTYKCTDNNRLNLIKKAESPKL